MILIQNLRLRFGPGTIYNPPIAYLVAGDSLTPIGRNANGTWLEVDVVASGQRGWIAAGEAFATCNIEVGSLPLGLIPPTPTSTNTPTPTVTSMPTETPTSGPLLPPANPDSGSSGNGGGDPDPEPTSGGRPATPVPP